MNIFPDKKKFNKLLKQYDIFPVYMEILSDALTPVSAYSKIRKTGESFLLESVEGDEKFSRYSIIGWDAGEKFIYFDDYGYIIKNNKKKKITAPPFEFLKEKFDKIKYPLSEEFKNLSKGAVGYLSYDCIRFFENIPDNTKDDLNLPNINLIWCEKFLIFDHIKKTVKIVLDCGKNQKIKTYNAAQNEFKKIIKKINKHKDIEILEKQSKSRNIRIKSNFKKKEFENIVRKAKKYIKEGDIFQVVLSQRFSAEYKGDYFNIYRVLRTVNPSPYMFYLDFKECKLIGASPEIMVKKENDILTLRPIAGTRKRGKTSEEDKNLEQDLLNDKKELAEHTMLVDLGRNDLGRVSEIGSVKVDEKYIIEKYSHVMHIVSNVVSKIDRKHNFLDVINATFPAGTVSGAPKIRAMEIIDELEKTKRGPYAGLVGYFNYNKDFDTCITIRTMLAKDNKIYIQSGAGIVADSVPENEYYETMNKAKALFVCAKDS